MADPTESVDFVGSDLNLVDAPKQLPNVTGGAGLPGAHGPAQRIDSPAATASASAGEVIFPLYQPALLDFRGGARYFGAPRPKGRLHAGVDLYAPLGAPVRAIADGVVIQAPYSFYQIYTDVWALEIHHPGIGTVRYGEIVRHDIMFAAGTKVKKGQLIAHVGEALRNKCMVHFELYRGDASGGLTQRSNRPYQRRADLLNPSNLIDRLIKATSFH